MSDNEITSLQTPPKGWFWSPEAREIRHRQRTTERVFHVGKSVDGPRADADPTAHLPTLMPGRDKLPQACIFCRSHLLTQEPPLGEHERGMLTCGGCGRQLAWLVAPLTAMAPPVVAVTPATAATARRRHYLEMMSASTRHRVQPGRFERLAGCGVLCSVAYGHDAESHEIHGRTLALAEMAARPSGVVRTGALVIDLDLDVITLDGVEIALTDIERRILLYLAARAGRLCPYPEIVEAIWGPEYVLMWGHHNSRSSRWQGLRVHVCRIYPKLGSSRALIETVANRGYRLRMEPPIHG